MTFPAGDPVAALASVRRRIDRAALAAGRDPAQVSLTAVCKQQPWSSIEALIKAGQGVFGENRVQEAARRWSERPRGVELRFIGALQSNKAREAVGLFDAIETLDRAALARPLADAIHGLGRAPRLSIQVNTGEEPQKAGVTPRALDAFVSSCRDEFGLRIEGLMCIPPVGEPPGPHFALLAKLAQRNGLGELSMGMSADFETAIAFGATAVRVGSALFGERPSPA